MTAYIICKDSEGVEFDRHEVLPGEAISEALRRLIRTGELAPLEAGDCLEITEK